MPQAIFEIKKDQNVLAIHRLPHVEVNKESVEAAILKICGLKSDQYEVHYLDAENDLIMAAVDQDYSIAEQTLEGDVIQFHIEVKVDEAELILSEELKSKQEQSDEQGNEIRSASQEQQASFSNPSSEDVLKHGQLEVNKDFQADEKGQEKNEIKEVTELLPKQGSNQVEQPSKIQENIIAVTRQPLQQKQQQHSHKARMAEAEVGQEGGSPSQQSQPPQNSDTNKSEKLVSSMSQKLLDINQQIPPPPSQADNNQIAQKNAGGCQPEGESSCNPNESGLIQKLLNDSELIDKLFNRFCLKLPQVLKQECFKLPIQQSQAKIINTQYIIICSRCQNKISQIPFYITQSNLSICQSCEQTFDEEELLVKIKSNKKMRQLLTVKIVPVLSEDLRKFSESEVELATVRENLELLRKRANEIALEKIGMQMKKYDEDRLFY